MDTRLLIRQPDGIILTEIGEALFERAFNSSDCPTYDNFVRHSRQLLNFD